MDSIPKSSDTLQKSWNKCYKIFKLSNNFEWLDIKRFKLHSKVDFQ